MLTGAYVRVEREGRWLSLDIAELTDDELTAFFDLKESESAKWAVFLAAWIRDNVDPLQ